MKKTWIVMADGANAAVFQYKGPGESLDRLVRFHSDEAQKQNREIGADAPGRSHEAKGTSRSAMENTDFRQLAKDRFADQLAEWLIKKQDEFAALILIAAPRTLGELRQSLHHGKIQAKIIQEIDKDYMSIPDQNLGVELDKIVKIPIELKAA